MSCCCCKEEGGCSNQTSSHQKQCCICNPFRADGLLLTAQITGITAVCLSWLWWPTCVLGAPILILFNVIWCCKMKKRGLIALGILCFLAFCTSLFTGAYMISRCWDELFTLLDNNGYRASHYHGDCGWRNETVWATLAFIDAALFLAASLCTFHFVRFRFDAIAAKLEQQHQIHHPEKALELTPAGGYHEAISVPLVEAEAAKAGTAVDNKGDSSV